MQRKTETNQKERISHHDWLARAMKVLSRERGAKFNIDNLCRELGVTKGSFYAHFKDRADFFEQFVSHWDEFYTQNVVDAIDQLQESSGEDRLLALMQLLQRERLARFDVAVRAWAAQEPIVAKGVQKVDRKRFEYIRQIFHDIGFRGTDLDLRTRLFVVYHSSKEGMRLPSSGLDPDEELKSRYEFFIRPIK